MSKNEFVPFSRDGLMTGKVILFFSSREDAIDFEQNFREFWVGHPYASSYKPSDYYGLGNQTLALRFHDGKWVNRGRHSTYDTGYSEYAKMFYETSVWPPVEVGDLL